MVCTSSRALSALAFWRGRAIAETFFGHESTSAPQTVPPNQRSAMTKGTIAMWAIHENTCAICSFPVNRDGVADELPVL
jgi:hypothetical protein